MRISGTEPSSVIRSKTKKFQKIESAYSAKRSWIQKDGLINLHNNNSNRFHMDNFDAPKMLRINHEMTVYLHIFLWA